MYHYNELIQDIHHGKCYQILVATRGGQQATYTLQGCAKHTALESKDRQRSIQCFSQKGAQVVGVGYNLVGEAKVSRDQGGVRLKQAFVERPATVYACIYTRPKKGAILQVLAPWPRGDVW